MQPTTTRHTATNNDNNVTQGNQDFVDFLVLHAIDVNATINVPLAAVSNFNDASQNPLDLIVSRKVRQQMERERAAGFFFFFFFLYV